MTEQRAALFGEGARLPEELSRLLFLEPVIRGRRVLEVGTRSDAVARFLLELGASRVVCASEERELVETLRAANSLDKVDFRSIRPGVLPGDDGAFDLVIDFGLPEALAAGVTFRLTDSPACLVAEENELSGNLLRMLKAAGQAAPESKPILEINPHHPLVQRLQYEDGKFNDWASILFDQAMLAEGGTLADPAGFVKKLNDMLLGMASK